MEVDPSDGKISFCLVDTLGFRVETTNDNFLFWKALAEIALELYEENGFVIYPVVEL